MRATKLKAMGMAMTTALAGAVLLGGCAPTVKIAPSDKPIVINLNIKIEHEIRVRVEKDVDVLLEKNSDLF